MPKPERYRELLAPCLRRAFNRRSLKAPARREADMFALGTRLTSIMD
jgi:hypothetical protein